MIYVEKITGTSFFNSSETHMTPTTSDPIFTGIQRYIQPWRSSFKVLSRNEHANASESDFHSYTNHLEPATCVRLPYSRDVESESSAQCHAWSCISAALSVQLLVCNICSFLYEFWAKSHENFSER